MIINIPNVVKKVWHFIDTKQQLIRCTRSISTILFLTVYQKFQSFDFHINN